MVCAAVYAYFGRDFHREYSIAVNLSADAENAIKLTNDGLIVNISGKVDKVITAVTGNFAIFGQSGAIIDSGFTFASDADVEAAFDSILNGDSNNGLHLLAGFADNTEQNFILLFTPTTKTMILK